MNVPEQFEPPGMRTSIEFIIVRLDQNVICIFLLSERGAEFHGVKSSSFKARVSYKPEDIGYHPPLSDRFCAVHKKYEVVPRISF